MIGVHYEYDQYFLFGRSDKVEYQRQLPEKAVFQFGLDFAKCTVPVPKQFFSRLAQLWHLVVPYLLFIHVNACYYVSVPEYI
jgi:hypothetical protein